MAKGLMIKVSPVKCICKTTDIRSFTVGINMGKKGETKGEEDQCSAGKYNGTSTPGQQDNG